MTNLLTKIPMVLTILTAGITGFIAVQKIATSTELFNDEVIEVPTQLNVDPAIGNQSNSGAQGGDKSVSETQTNVQLASATGTQMTLAELKQHNTSSSCYIAYNSVIYDVTNHPSWRGCYHHGIGGGQDITSRFPHPKSYISAIPVVGTLIGGSTSSNTGVTSDSDDNDNDEREDELEIESDDNEREDD